MKLSLAEGFGRSIVALGGSIMRAAEPPSPTCVRPHSGGSGAVSGARTRRASPRHDRHDVARASRAFRPGRLAAGLAGALVLLAAALPLSRAWADLPQPSHFDPRRSGTAGTIATGDTAWNGDTGTLNVVVSGRTGSDYRGNATVCPNDGGFDGAYDVTDCTTTTSIDSTSPGTGQAAFDVTLSGATGAPLYYVILQFQLAAGSSDAGYVEFVFDTNRRKLTPGRRETTAPTLTSIERADPASEVATTRNLSFRVTFSEEVYSVGAADFALSGDAGEIKNAVPRDAGDTRNIHTDNPSAVWRVRVAGAGLPTHNGPVGLSLASGRTIADASGANPLTATTATGTVEGYTVANGPTLDIGEPADLTWTAGTKISPLRLPQASGGVAPYTYSLDGTLPEGISFQADMRRLSGTPSMVQSATEMTWKVEDAAGGMDAETFTITVNPGPGVTISTQSLTVPEGESRTYTVQLNTQPAADVEVRLVRQGQDGDIRVSPDRLTFTMSNWNTPQTVTVSAVAGRRRGGRQRRVPAPHAQRGRQHLRGRGFGPDPRDRGGRRRHHGADGGLHRAPRRQQRAGRADQRRQREVPGDDQRGRAERGHGGLRRERRGRRHRRGAGQRQRGAVHRDGERRQPFGLQQRGGADLRLGPGHRRRGGQRARQHHPERGQRDLHPRTTPRRRLR